MVKTPRVAPQEVLSAVSGMCMFIALLGIESTDISASVVEKRIEGIRYCREALGNKDQLESLRITLFYES